MDVYNTFHSHLAAHHELLGQDLIDCDIKDVDLNYNDATFDMQVYSEGFQQHMKGDKNPLKIHGSLPADLTNLQWLQSMNVALPVDHTTSHDNVMVDPNTVMPVHHNWPSSSSSAAAAAAAAATVVGTTLTLQQTTSPNNLQQLTRQPMSDTKAAKNNVAISAIIKEEKLEKSYPKPVFSYSCLIAMALQDSEAGTLPVSEIYKFMQSNFPYFKTAPDGWKNSVRHNLSLNKAFCKLDRPQGASQRKGCLWTLKPEKKEQMSKEIKKWKKKHADSIKASMARPEEFHISPNDDMQDNKLCQKRTAVIDDHIIVDAAKDLFGNGIMEEINSEAFWDDIMSSSSPDSLKYVDHSFAAAAAAATAGIAGPSCENYPSEVSTTVEVDSSMQYYDHIPNVGNYYSNTYLQTVNY